jgi:hypothetical protein
MFAPLSSPSIKPLSALTLSRSLLRRAEIIKPRGRIFIAGLLRTTKRNRAGSTRASKMRSTSAVPAITGSSPTSKLCSTCWQLKAAAAPTSSGSRSASRIDADKRGSS